MLPSIGIIPARYASSRFPGKPLALIGGKPMVQRVYERAIASELDRVLIATDHEGIADCARSFGAEVVLTSSEAPSGTARCLEVIEKLDVQEALIVNIQGDEPFIKPEQINQVLALLRDQKAELATLISPAENMVEVQDPNRVKVVVDAMGRALYFSRRAIPYFRESDEAATPASFFIHLGMYAYTAACLKAIGSLAPSPLQNAENLEQLAWLEHGYRIHTAVSKERAEAVDSPADLEAIQKKYFL